MKLKPIALLAAAVCLGANAQEMSEVTISALRTPTPLSKTPASVSVVTQEDFTAGQAATVGDVLRKLPNVEFGGGPRSDGELPTIRGYQGNDITLIVDGARRNANYSLTTPLFLDPFFLTRAEVVRGSTSSLYGSGGLGGAMVFTTINGRDLLKDGRTSGADTRVAYGSGDNSTRTSGRVYGVQDDLDAVIAATYYDFAEIELPSGAKLSPNRGHGVNALAKLGWQQDGLTRYEFSHQTFDRSAFEYNNPQVATGGFIQPTHNSQGETVLSASGKNSDGEQVWKASFYNTKTGNQRDAYDTNAYWNSTLVTNGLGLQKTTDLNQHRLTYGFDGYVDELQTIQGTAANPVNPDGKRQAVGAFMQDIWALNSDWRFIPSVRYDEFKTNPANASFNSTSDSHVSPKATVSWQANANLNVYGSYGEAFRAPTLWEMYQQNLTPGGFRLFKANPDLKPQTDTTLEVGSNFSQKNVWTPSDRLTLRGAIFSTESDNLIQQVTVAGNVGARGSTLQYQNVQHAKRKGGEVAGNYLNGLWSFDAGYSRVRVVNSDTGENLFASPDKLNTKLGYAIPQSSVRVSWGMTAVAAQDYDSTTLRQRSGYAMHDLSMTWFSPKKDYRLDAGVYNVGNKEYVVYQSSNSGAVSAYEMGRNYRVSFSASF